MYWVKSVDDKIFINSGQGVIGKSLNDVQQLRLHPVGLIKGTEKFHFVELLSWLLSNADFTSEYLIARELSIQTTLSRSGNPQLTS